MAPSPPIGTRREGWTLSVAPARGLQETQPPFLPEAGAQVTCTGSQHPPDSGVGLGKHEGHLAGRRGLSKCPLVLSRWRLQGHLIILTSICQVSLIFFFKLTFKKSLSQVKSARRFKGPEGRSHRTRPGRSAVWVWVPVLRSAEVGSTCGPGDHVFQSQRQSRPWVTPVEFRIALEEPGPVTDCLTWRLAPTGLSQTHSREFCTELDAQSSLLLINA